MSNDPTRVLVVDDQMMNRALLIEYLEQLDLLVDEADSGEVCLKMLKEQTYALVLLDIQMPRMDGFKTLEHMRMDDALQDIPVIFISAVFDTDEYIIKGIEGGAIDFMPKPINPDILKSKVYNFIRFYDRQRKLDSMVRSLEVMNERLKANDSKFRRITQSASDAIILLDKQRRIQFWNAASKKIFGYNKFEVVSEDFQELLISERSYDTLHDQFLKMDENPASLFSAIRLYAKNKLGVEFPIEMSMAVFQTAQHENNYTAIIRDITHRVKIEKEALSAKELRESNKVMKEFMDNVSHELRTPMNAIIGISNMLLKYNAENLAPKQIEGLQIINQSGIRLLDLINDVLDLSRLEGRKETINIEKFDLDKYLAELNSSIISLIGEKPLKFHIRKSTSVPGYISTDQKKLQQILINLIGNSIKFTAKGKVLLRIHLIDRKLYFEVADTGIGIEKKNLKRIFERFQQIDNTSKKEYKGTGLGLNIVKKLVELMNGEIKAESEPGKGTIMQFFIPVETKALSDAENSPRTGTEKIDLKSGTEQSDKLSLLIDADRSNHYLFSNLLLEKGYKVLTCYDSSNGITAAKRYLPQLIILNMEMPRIHGTHIINKIESIPELNQVPILAYTSIEDFKLRTNNSNLKLYKSLPTEQEIQNTIAGIKIPSARSIGIDTVCLYEIDCTLNDIIVPELLKIKNEFFKLGLLALSQRKVKNLILDGISPNGENLRLVKELISTPDIIPDKTVVISEKPFKFIIEDLKKLKNFELISIEKAKVAISLDELLNSKE